MTTLTELRRLREAQLLTQHELGAKAGLSNVAISRIETSRTRPRFSTVKKLAAALGVKPAALTESVR